MNVLAHFSASSVLVDVRWPVQILSAGTGIEDLKEWDSLQSDAVDSLTSVPVYFYIQILTTKAVIQGRLFEIRKTGSENHVNKHQ